MNIYNAGYRNDSTEHIRNRHIVIDPVTAVIIQQRLKLYTNWQHPGMIIRPAHAKYVEDLVACDPMYFVDTSDQLLELTESWFTPEYQRRLRHYVIEEYNNQPTFINLPAGQFGLIYAFHYFNFKPMEIIKDYLSEIYNLLRPSGVVAFTFNDCDFGGAVRLTEHHFCCYTPGRLIKEHAMALGFAIELDFNDEAGTNWLELRKPGEYSSIRGGQTLAAIHQRSTESNITNVIDKPPESAYNELNMLLNIAQRLGIDLKQCVSKGQYSAKKLRRSIEQSVHPQPLTEQMIRELFNQRKNS
jgi:SAM-dependent methyltransferase